VPLFGGIAYLDYRGKLHHRSIRQEPYATYERLDQWVDDLPLVAISTGVVRDSGDVHSRMRPRYLQEHAEWSQEKWHCARLAADGALYVGRVGNGLARQDRAARGAIGRAFGVLMNQNHRLVNDMMAYCGFGDGAGWANNLCIDVALKKWCVGRQAHGRGAAADRSLRSSGLRGRKS